MTSKQKIYTVLLVLSCCKCDFTLGVIINSQKFPLIVELTSHDNLIRTTDLPKQDNPLYTFKPPKCGVRSVGVSQASSEDLYKGVPSHQPHEPVLPPAVYFMPIESYIEDNYSFPQHIPLYDPFSYEDERIQNIYWQDKLDKLQEMIRDISSNEDNILMLLQEIISHAPEKYRYEAYNSFQGYKLPKKQLLLFSDEDGELSLVYIPECLMYGSKSEQKEEVVIHLTSDPKLFDRVFRVVPIRERPKVSEASRIRRERQEAEYREQQRIHAEQYKAKERALKRANGEDMIFDPRVGKRVHFEDYLRSLFLSQLAEARKSELRNNFR